MPLQFAGDHVSSNQASHLAIDDDEIHHLGPRMHLDSFLTDLFLHR